MPKFCELCTEDGLKSKIVKLKTPLETFDFGPGATTFDKIITHRCEECGWGFTEEELKSSA